VSDRLKQDPDAILVLEGRTDSTGDPLYNEQLGQRRVDAAKNYLVLEMGVPVYRIHGFSYGEARPEYDNEVPDDRQKNRSVKLLILTPNSPATTVAALPE
jgi:OmpA-OmpF porin, OOP family